jgi:DNA-binding NarL/FixJ family response regulator
MSPLRVMVADDSVLFREGLTRLLAEQDLEIVAQVDNGDDLVRRAAGLRPDVCIVDIRMPPTHTSEGLEAARTLAERQPGVGVLVLSQHLATGWALRLLEDATPGRGYVLKDSVVDVRALCDAVRRVAEGESVVDAAIGRALLERTALDELTPREREILALMAEGRSNRGICDRLCLTARTVETHVTAIMRKLGLDAAPDDHRRVLAVLAYLRER